MNVIFQNKAFDLFFDEENQLCVDNSSIGDYFRLSEAEIDQLIAILQHTKRTIQAAK